jgi:hypothetical protein
MSRKAIHALLALILVICLVCPFVELALGWHDSVFLNGHDSESTLAVLVLLFELVLAMASVFVRFLPGSQLIERFVIRYRVLTSEFGFGIILPSSSPPLSLRI